MRRRGKIDRDPCNNEKWSVIRIRGRKIRLSGKNTRESRGADDHEQRENQEEEEEGRQSTAGR